MRFLSPSHYCPLKAREKRFALTFWPAVLVRSGSSGARSTIAGHLGVCPSKSIMKPRHLLAWITGLCLGAATLQAQQSGELEQLKKIVQQQQQQIDALTKRLDELTKSQSGPAAPVVPPAAAPKTDEQKKLEEQLTKELQNNPPPAAAAAPASPPAVAESKWSPSQPITVARAGSAYMNISFDALADVGGSTASDPSAKLQLGDHDPTKNGFSLRNAEISVDGAVDPYLKGFGNIVLKLDKNNQTEVELEEAYLMTTSLPGNLQVKAGQFFAAFGRQNPQHPHQWAFVDQPLILNRAFGPDGLRSISAQASWLVPTPFYTEAFLGIMDGQGGTAFAFRNPGDPDINGVGRVHGRATLDRSLGDPADLVFVPRIASSFELTDQQTLVAGVSGAFGPNDTGTDRRTQIYGADLYWKWKPAHADAGFPFVSWQTEGLYERFEAGADPLAPIPLPAETLEDWGFYSQVLWGFKPRWVAGLRGDYVDGNKGMYDPSDIYRGNRTRVSPNLTFYPSEFSKLRLQYNFDHGALFGDQHTVWLQLEFLLGAHGAHKF